MQAAEVLEAGRQGGWLGRHNISHVGEQRYTRSKSSASSASSVAIHHVDKGGGKTGDLMSCRCVRGRSASHQESHSQPLPGTSEKP